MMAALLKPKIIEFNAGKYYNVVDLMAYDRAYFLGCNKSGRGIIAKKSLKPDQYVYATWSKKDSWKLPNPQKGLPTKAKVLIKESWIVANYPKLMPQDAAGPSKSKYIVEPTPELIHLTDSEKFTNADGPVDIETRGNRSSSGVYFLAKDVSESFAMPNLITTVMHKDKGYIKNTHYKTFSDADLPNHTNNVRKKRLYITYAGMLKILFTSRVGIADTFLKWAMETLFTVQMGSDDQKDSLISNMIGIPAKDIKLVLRTATKSVPCVYRFALGCAKDLRTEMSLPDNIPDNFTIIKYGLTENLVRRTGEHISEYGKIPGAMLGLMNFTYIDPIHLSKAECDIKAFFEAIETKISYKNYNELIAINPAHEKIIKNQFSYISTEYAGCVAELNAKLIKLTDENSRIKAQLRQSTDMHNKELDHIKEIHRWELSDKDRIIENKNLANELIALKLEIALSK